jgi:cytochrome c oxidase subunit 2
MTSFFRFAMIVLCCISCTSRRNPPLRTADIDNGKVLYNTCGTCHGGRGEGNVRLRSSALANLDPWYASRQLKNFKEGLRGYLPEDSTGVLMAAMAKSLKDTTDIQDVIAYIETFPDVKLEYAATGDIRKGERTYQTLCGSCHGPAATGNKLMNAPRLNGLEPWYLKSQIKKFQKSFRGAHPKDIYGAPMVPMMALLKDEQMIDNVIAYIRSTAVETVSQ